MIRSEWWSTIGGDFSIVRNSVVVLKFGKAGGGDGAGLFSTTVDKDVRGGGGGGVGGLLKKSFDVSSKWLAFVISSCTKRTWSLWIESTSVTLRPLLINGRPLNDSGKCSNKSVWIVVEFERVLSISCRWELLWNGKYVEGGGTLLERAVVVVDEDEISEPECKRAFNRSVMTSSSPNWRLKEGKWINWWSIQWLTYWRLFIKYDFLWVSSSIVDELTLAWPPELYKMKIWRIKLISKTNRSCG